MKEGFLGFLAILSFEVCCMEKTVYFSTIHEDNPSITVRAYDGIKLLDSFLTGVDEVVISTAIEDGFEVSLSHNLTSGTVAVYSSDNLQNVLLKLSVEKTSSYSPAIVKLLEKAQKTKATLFRPSMGGGDSFVLMIGVIGSDFSSAKIQSILPFGAMQFYAPIEEL